MLARGLLRHECMHIIQEEIFNKTFGIPHLPQNIAIRELELINKFIAESAFSEYFANQKSILLFKQAAHEVTEFKLLVDTITECTEKVAELREQIVTTNDIGHVYECWSMITGYVSKVANAMGRGLSLCDEDRTTNLLNDMIEAACPSWSWVVGEFYMTLSQVQASVETALREGHSANREDLFIDLYKAVESCFYQLSVKGELNTEGRLIILTK